MKFEKQLNFKEQVKEFEDKVTKLKDYSNDLVYRVALANKKNKSLDFLLTTFQMEDDFSKEIQQLSVINEKSTITDNDLVNAIIQKESLMHMMENYRLDILKLKKNTERLKRIRKKFNIFSHDLDYELERYRSMNQKIQMDILKRNNEHKNYTGGGYKDDNVSIDSIFAQNLNDEMSQFEDRIIIEQIKDHEAKLEMKKAEEIQKKKKILDLKRIKDKEIENNRRRKENSF